jgi:hypothetical protein
MMGPQAIPIEAGAVQDTPKARRSWLRPFTVTMLTISVVVSAPPTLLPVWNWVDALGQTQAFGLYGGDFLEFFLIVLMTPAFILDVVAVVLTLVLGARKHKMANLIMGVVAMIVTGGPFAVTYIGAAIGAH